MATPQTSGTSPIVPVRDVDKSLAFYNDCLGFVTKIGNPEHGYALVQRDALMIALIKAGDDAALAATANNISAQLWVKDVDALWSEFESKSADFPDGCLGAPFDRSYGVREMHIKDPDGFLMFFTQIQPNREGE